MMSLFVGLGNLAIGAAYLGLGLLSGWEAASQFRSRGLSRFGLGFSLMAASCGPHHLVHGWCVLQEGTVSAPMLAITVIGLPAGLVFVLLRIEVMLRGLGDRVVVVTPRAMALAAVLLLGVVGALGGWSAATPPVPGQALCTAGGLLLATSAAPWSVDPRSLVFATNLFVTVTYAMVGWYLFDTQIRRYVANRCWSLSGLSLAAVFPTCAAMHLIVALTSSPDSATLPFDILGVPASIYFLWVVRRLHTDSVVDWNRSPLAGFAEVPRRAAPWSNLPVSGLDATPRGTPST
jgi:hypothetical protein